MRWITNAAVLACAGLLACGSGGVGGGDEDAASSSRAGDEETGAERTEDGGGGAQRLDAGNCPPVDEMEDLTSETVTVADYGRYDPDAMLACNYGSEEIQLIYTVRCYEHASEDEARAGLAEWMENAETSPYPVGDEGIIGENEEFEGQPTILSQRAGFRSGTRHCELAHQFIDPTWTERPDGVEDAMLYLANAAAEI
jgi:hypothetical protein